MKTALVFGVAGQDGSYLAELLLSKSYRVVGVDRAEPIGGFVNLAGLRGRIELLECDVRDTEGVLRIVKGTAPSEVYNLAGTTNVAETWDRPVSAADETALGALRILDSIQRACPEARMFQANSSEMFGSAAVAPQDEETPLSPRNPYGAAKVYVHHMVNMYRVRHGIFACSGILFNHESPRRPPLFVTRKIADGAAAAKLGVGGKLALGDLEARRDWGFAGDFAWAMWAMLQADTPQDFVLGTGEQHSVGEFCELAYGHVALNYRDYVEPTPGLMRANDVSNIVANPAKAERVLGWRRQLGFSELVRCMVDAGVERLVRTRAGA